jgi:hypothetical protein
MSFFFEFELESNSGISSDAQLCIVHVETWQHSHYHSKNALMRFTILREGCFHLFFLAAISQNFFFAFFVSLMQKKSFLFIKDFILLQVPKFTNLHPMNLLKKKQKVCEINKKVNLYLVNRSDKESRYYLSGNIRLTLRISKNENR